VNMANSKYEYVRNFELDDSMLKNTWIVIRIDGRGFHKFTEAHGFTKPNDERCLNLMNKSAETCMIEFSDVVLAYGQSDEYSFVLKKGTTLYGRRSSKIVTAICSLFTSAFVMNWKTFFPDLEIRYPPSFDGRAICYPSDQNLRDYISWRQVDCHINNLYNTCFWAIVHSGKTPHEAQERLKKTFSNEKNEILFSEFGINYNNLPQLYRKGTILVNQEVEEMMEKNGQQFLRKKKKVVQYFEDAIQDAFWEKINFFPLYGEDQSTKPSISSDKERQQQQPTITSNNNTFEINDVLDNIDRMINSGLKCYFRADDVLPDPLPISLQGRVHSVQGSAHYFEVTPAEYRQLGPFVGIFEVEGLKMTRHMLNPNSFQK